ncbi:hypothetical protein GF360_01340 [candidate division WWE3 bacterium]|nr:hypothetical protein [candidate division WWE3 bacterium]
MKALPESLEGFNILHVVLDSLRFDSASRADTPVLDSLGPLIAARTLAPYTPAAHAAAWLGHFPSAPTSALPYYNETVRQPLRITTGPARDANKGCGMLLDGADVLDGLCRKGYSTLGWGGVSQFSTGSWLRQFAWDHFTYFGVDMDEEPLAPRAPETFPLNLNRVGEILSTMSDYGKVPWFLFLNDPAPHYPYDWGEGITEEVREEAFPLLKLNLRSHHLAMEKRDMLALYAPLLQQMQVDGLERYIDPGLGELFKGLRQISDRPVFAIVHADHGEYFGEDGLYGHMHGGIYDMTVPLWIGVL